MQMANFDVAVITAIFEINKPSTAASWQYHTPFIEAKIPVYSEIGNKTADSSFVWIYTED